MFALLHEIKIVRVTSVRGCQYILLTSHAQYGLSEGQHLQQKSQSQMRYDAGEDSPVGWEGFQPPEGFLKVGEAMRSFPGSQKTFQGTTPLLHFKWRMADPGGVQPRVGEEVLPPATPGAQGHLPPNPPTYATASHEVFKFKNSMGGNGDPTHPLSQMLLVLMGNTGGLPNGTYSQDPSQLVLSSGNSLCQTCYRKSLTGDVGGGTFQGDHSGGSQGHCENQREGKKWPTYVAFAAWRMGSII